MKRILPLLLILLLILTGCSAKNADSPAADAPTDAPLTGISYVQIDVKDYGTIVAELYADTAPITVANFLSLVDSGCHTGSSSSCTAPRRMPALPGSSRRRRMCCPSTS